MDTSETSPFRSLIPSIPGHQAKPTLAAFVWKQPWAQSSLGFMYATGDGVIQEFILAYMWMSISASNGLEDAALYIAKVETMMTSDQIVKAKELARECAAKNYKDC